MTTLPIVLVENNGVGKEGSSTFYSTGKVLATGRRITNDGVAINNVTVTNYDSDGGDSGGVVFDTSFRRLAGIHQGARKDGTEHYYVVEADIRSSLGVTPY
ncbi:S1 family peptidase [Phocaeicola massiliensis]|uniref:S1 family peptidase n=1 Tax=Phocaeicola massiliensis TaxID=204516 RepID=UPI0020304A68|nr:S1 family peptidase [Phocaeicola massiliensis]MCM1616378.1 S1 family peptidase [Phocaeicola massiliensis]MCM1708044.1 S1 family peptidase [Phocaeicola massiliensis]